jgi:hypothetical protein
MSRAFAQQNNFIPKDAAPGFLDKHDLLFNSLAADLWTSFASKHQTQVRTVRRAGVGPPSVLHVSGVCAAEQLHPEGRSARVLWILRHHESHHADVLDWSNGTDEGPHTEL